MRAQLCGLFLLLPTLVVAEAIEEDEIVLLVESAAALKNGQWQVPVHAWVHEPEYDSWWRARVANNLFGRYAIGDEEYDTNLYNKRLWPFLYDNERGKSIVLHSNLPDDPGWQLVGETERNGHLHGQLQLPRNTDKPVTLPKWIKLEVQTPPGDARKFRGEVQLLPETGISVISDIDDTIRITRVLLRDELFANTLLRRWQPVPGMAERYARWAKEGVSFHYVSGSPFQLYESIREFILTEGFPLGSFHLRHIRLTDSSLFNIWATAMAYKTPSITDLLTRFPGRCFVLIGDLGEHDADVYAAAASTHRDQVSAIWLRRPDEVEDPLEVIEQRLVETLQEHPELPWRIFEDGEQLPEQLPGCRARLNPSASLDEPD